MLFLSRYWHWRILVQFPEIWFKESKFLVQRVSKSLKHLIQNSRTCWWTTIQYYGKAVLCIQFGLNNYKRDFLILEQMSSTILGNPFFVKNDTIIHHSKKLLSLPDFTMRMNSLNSQSKFLSHKNLVLETVSNYVKTKSIRNHRSAIRKHDIIYKLTYGPFNLNWIEKKIISDVFNESIR